MQINSFRWEFNGCPHSGEGEQNIPLPNMIFCHKVYLELIIFLKMADTEEALKTE